MRILQILPLIVMSPATMVADLYDQYIPHLRGVLDRHVPLSSRELRKNPAAWLSDSYHRAKSISQQFEDMCRKDKSQLSKTRLHRQIDWCITIVNRDKAE